MNIIDKIFFDPISRSLKFFTKDGQAFQPGKVYNAIFKPTPNVAYGGYSAIPTLTIPSSLRSPNELTLTSDTKGVIAPVSGVMHVGGWSRWSTLGGSGESRLYINGVSVDETFVPMSSATLEYPLPFRSVRVNAGDYVSVGIGGFPSNTFSAADQSTWYFTLYADK